MAHFTFRGGIELLEKNERTKNLPIKIIFPGKKLIFPLEHQEIPAVLPGEYVKAGQLIAKSENSMMRIHASVSGIVKAVEVCQTISGRKYPSIIIENDEKYSEIDFGEFMEADDLENRQILARIMSAGIVDSRNKSIPLAESLDMKEPQKIRHIIVNCAESEPYHTALYRYAVERPEWIIEGLRILLKLFPNAKGILAVHQGEQEAITALHKIMGDSQNIKIVPTKLKYPQDTERMLIYACTGKRINSSKNAEDARCIVLNGDTAYAICNAVTFGMPMYQKIVTVSGECLKSPQNAQVRIGMRLSDLVAAAEGYVETPDWIISGGSMRGGLVNDLDAPLTKEMVSLLCLKKKGKEEKPEQMRCISCGRCMDVCNENLLPAKLFELALNGKEETFLRYGGMECCECGSCSYVCPSRRNLTQEIRAMKNKILTEE